MGRVKVIIQTLDDTYLKYLYKGQFSNGYKSNLRAGGSPKFVAVIQGVFGYIARILGHKGFVLSEESC